MKSEEEGEKRRVNISKNKDSENTKKSFDSLTITRAYRPPGVLFSKAGVLNESCRFTPVKLRVFDAKFRYFEMYVIRRSVILKSEKAPHNVNGKQLGGFHFRISHFRYNYNMASNPWAGYKTD